jgi:hypothetical protein
MESFDGMARSVFGMSGSEFEMAYYAGIIADSGELRDLASVLSLIERLRERDKIVRIGRPL